MRVPVPFLSAIALIAALSQTSNTPSIYALEFKAAKAYNDKQYGESEHLFAAAFAAGLNRFDDYYNAACASALAGDEHKAIEYLERAAASGYHDSGNAKSDPDLKSVRSNPRLAVILQRIEENERAYERNHNDPERAAIVTSDIDLFWSVVDRTKAATNPASVVEQDYFRQGSPGLQDFIFARIQSGDAQWSVMKNAPKYYASLRASSTRIKEFTPQIRASFRKLKDLYPDSIFPDIYFLIGRMNSAATTGPSGLLIGADMFASAPHVPVDELDEWHRSVIQPVTNIPGTVAHELIHYRQNRQSNTLFTVSIREGSADFIGNLISGQNMNRHIMDYGLQHEAELWTDFSHDMHGTDTSHWMYQGKTANGRPADLAYFEGYWITEAYYNKTSNKKKAISDILNFTDADQLLKASGYGPAN